MLLVLSQCNAQPAGLCAHTAAMVLHINVKTYGGSGGTALRTLNPGTRWRQSDKYCSTNYVCNIFQGALSSDSNTDCYVTIRKSVNSTLNI
jgi:hypothetical protein